MPPPPPSAADGLPTSPPPPAQPAAPTSPAPRGRRARSLRLLRVGLALVALLFLALALASRWDEVSGQLGRISPLDLLAGLVFAVLGLSSSLVGWRALLADLGSPLPWAVATRVLFLGQVAKYLPGGSVWAIAAQTELARDFGVPRRRAASAGLALNLVTLVVGLCLALVSLPLLLEGGQAQALVRWLPVLVVLGLVVLVPPVLTRVCSTALRLLRREPLDRPFTWRGLLAAAAGALATWVFYGLHIVFIAAGLGADPWSLLLPATGAFAAAWCAGFLVVIVPTGAGTREAVLTVALAGQLAGGTTAALTVAVVSRLLLTVADGVTALAGLALARRSRRGARP